MDSLDTSSVTSVTLFSIIMAGWTPYPHSLNICDWETQFSILLFLCWLHNFLKKGILGKKLIFQLLNQFCQNKTTLEYFPQWIFVTFEMKQMTHWSSDLFEAGMLMKRFLMRLLISNDRAFKPYDPLQSLIRHNTGEFIPEFIKKYLSRVINSSNMKHDTGNFKIVMYSMMFDVFMY